MKHLYPLFILSAVLILSSDISAQHYWVGGTGDWSDASHWATTSGGSTFHDAPPTMDDDVYFDGNSFTSGGQSVTMDVDQAECKTMDWSAVTNNPGFNFAGSETLNIYGSLILSPDMTCNTRFVEMESDGTVSISTAGTDLGASAILRLQGTGTYNLNSVLVVREVQMQQGTFNTNGNSISCEFAFRVSGTFPKTVNLGSSRLDLRQWRNSGTNTTINATSSQISCQSFYGDESASGPYTYGEVIIDGGGLLYNSCTINMLTLQNDEFNETVRVQSGATISCGQFNLNATRYAPIEFIATDEGQHATISQASGTATAEYAIMRDIHAAGGANFVASNTADLGNNDGWTINPVEIMDFYWVGGDGVWTDADHWAMSSGGTDMYDRYPSQFDNALFDENSFDDANQKVVLDTPAQVNNMDWSGAGHNPSLSREDFYDDLRVFGSINMTDSVDLSVASISMNGYGAGKTVHLGNDNAFSNLSFWGESDWTLLSDITCGNFSAYAGHVNTNDRDISVNFSFTVGNTRGGSIDLTDSDITTLNFRIRNEDNEFNAGTSHITVRGELEGSGFEFDEVTLAESVTVKDQNTFALLRVAPGASVAFEADSTQTIRVGLMVNGTPSEPISLSSTIVGRQATLSQPAGTVSGIYLVLQDMNATGGATFNADQSIDKGNNTGWNITEIMPLDFYWVGGSGSWSDAENHWAKSSGGSDFYNFVPGPLDDVYFDANSFSDMGQTVVLDIDQINFNNMDWTGVTEMPVVNGPNTDVNIYGSITFSPLTNIDVRNYNFLSDGEETIDFGDPTFPGTNSYLSFTGGGTWNIQDSLTTREIQFYSGTINTNGHGVHVDFQTIFHGPDRKDFNLGTSNYYTRQLNWGGAGSENLGFDGDESKIFCSSSFNLNSPTVSQPDDVTLNELTFVASQDHANVYGDLHLRKLTIEAGKSITFNSFHTIYVDEFVAIGREDAFINISGQTEGSQATISQASGTVDGQYLELKDVAATGGATFNAYNSINNGNVSGWTFFGQAQTIDFPEIQDMPEGAGPFDIMATASSGLDVEFEIVGGPATLEGSTVTLTGAGEVQIKASQPGNINFNPAPSIIRSFCVIPDKPTISEAGTDPVTLTSSRVDGNQWFFEGSPIVGATDQDYIATENGTYTVQIVFGLCTSEMSDPVEVTTTYTNDLLASGAVRLMPNPVSDRLTIQFDQPINGLLYTTILDGSGRVQFTNAMNAVTQQLELDVSSLPAGIYFVMGQCEQGVFRTPVVVAR